MRASVELTTLSEVYLVEASQGRTVIGSGASLELTGKLCRGRKLGGRGVVGDGL